MLFVRRLALFELNNHNAIYKTLLEFVLWLVNLNNASQRFRTLVCYHNPFVLGFFNPYGEIANIQIIPVGQKFPEECHKFIDTHEFDETCCAIVEFLTARVAKFVVGVLRKRIEALNFRIGLLKPGLAEEMAIQEARLKESIYMPSYQINQTQEAMLNVKTDKSYSSEELSEVELKQSRNKVKSRHFTNTFFSF